MTRGITSTRRKPPWTITYLLGLAALAGSWWFYLTTRSGSVSSPKPKPQPPALLQSNLSLLALSSESKPCAPFLCVSDPYPSSPSHHLQVPPCRHSRSPLASLYTYEQPASSIYLLLTPIYVPCCVPHCWDPSLQRRFSQPPRTSYCATTRQQTETRTRTRKSRDLTCHSPCPALFEVTFSQRAEDQERNAYQN